MRESLAAKRRLSLEAVVRWRYEFGKSKTEAPVSIRNGILRLSQNTYRRLYTEETRAVLAVVARASSRFLNC